MPTYLDAEYAVKWYIPTYPTEADPMDRYTDGQIKAETQTHAVSGMRNPNPTKPGMVIKDLE